MKYKYKIHLLEDVLIILLSIFAALFLAKNGAIAHLLAMADGLKMIGTVLVGMFFTSVFTVAPAAVALGKIAQTNSALHTAIFGALGAALGDLIIFLFIKDRFAKDIAELMRKRSCDQKLKIILHRKFFRWLTFIMGGIIIASPLPDELGIGLMGFSRMNTFLFLLVSFFLNALGIVIIGL